MSDPHAEIKELKTLLSWTEQNNELLRSDCRKYTKLLGRAADALEALIRFNKSNCLQEMKFIAELRKAAE